MERVDLAEKLGSFTETWSPRIVGELNGQHVKVVKVEGEFLWHHHDEEDELFLVLEGRLRIEFRDQAPISLEKDQFLIVPRGVEHKPVAEPKACVLLMEPASTRNTGNVSSNRTVEDPKRI